MKIPYDVTPPPPKGPKRAYTLIKLFAIVLGTVIGHYIYEWYV